MDLEEFELLDYNEKDSFPLFSKEVFEYCKKRKLLLNDFKNNKSFKNFGNNVVFEKTFEYTQRFSKGGNKEAEKIRKFIEEFIDKKKKNNLELRIYLCKLVDLSPKKVSFFFDLFYL
jgi:hypothetical protein